MIAAILAHASYDGSILVDQIAPGAAGLLFIPLVAGLVLLAAMIVLFGGLLFLLRYGATLPRYDGFQGEPSDLRSISGIVAAALSLRSRGLIQLGLLLLMATPIARVAFLTVAFARQRDRLYAAMALIVLTLLFYSLAGGFSF